MFGSKKKEEGKLDNTVNISSEIMEKVELLEKKYPGLKDCLNKYFSKFKENNIEIIGVLPPNEEGHIMAMISFLETSDKKSGERLEKELWLLFSDKKWSIPPYLNKP